MVRDPVLARRLTVTVIVDVPAPLMLAGLKPTVTLDPWPDAERLIDELNPPLTAVVRVVLPEKPRVMVSDAGLALIVKSGVAPGMVSVTVVVSFVLPDVPVTVIGYVPGAALDPTAMVMLELLPAEIGFVVNPMVTPEGCPDAARVIEPENPPVAELEIVVDPLPFVLTVTELGDAEMVNPAGGGPLSALINAACGLPQPVTRSYPVTAE